MKTLREMGWQELCAHVEKFNNKLKTSLFLLKSQFDALGNSTPQSNTIVIEIVKEFNTIRPLFEKHLKVEMEEFFPRVKGLCQMETSGDINPVELEKLLKLDMAYFKQEHDALKKSLVKVRKLANDYHSSHDSEPAEKLSMAYLFNFEQDFYLHAFIHESILWPRITDLENKLRKQLQAM